MFARSGPLGAKAHAQQLAALLLNKYHVPALGQGRRARAPQALRHELGQWVA